MAHVHLYMYLYVIIIIIIIIILFVHLRECDGVAKEPNRVAGRQQHCGAQAACQAVGKWV